MLSQLLKGLAHLEVGVGIVRLNCGSPFEGSDSELPLPLHQVANTEIVVSQVFIRVCRQFRLEFFQRLTQFRLPFVQKISQTKIVMSSRETAIKRDRLPEFGDRFG